MDDLDARRLKLDRHAAAELLFDLDAVMDTVDDDPSYEWHPGRKGIVGRESVARMYSVFLPRWKRLAQSADLVFEVRSEFWNDEARIREQVAHVRDASGDIDHFDFVVVVLLGERGVTGERTYACDELYHLMFGDYYDELPRLDLNERTPTRRARPRRTRSPRTQSP